MENPTTTAAEATRNENDEESTTTNSLDSLDSLQVKIKSLELELLKQEEQFSEKRGLFQQLYVNKENELKNAMEQIDKLQRELTDVRSAAELSENGRDEEYSTLRGNYESQMNSLQAILNESNEEQHRLNQEKEQLLNERKKLLKQIHAWESHSNVKSPTSSIRSNSPMRTIDTQSTFSSVSLSPQRSANAISSSSVSSAAAAAPTTAGQASTTNVEQKQSYQHQQQLEEQMERAMADADALRTIIQPYEEEITNLKIQINNENEKLTNLFDQLQKAKERNQMLQSMWQKATRQHLDWREENIRLLLDVTHFLSDEQCNKLRTLLQQRQQPCFNHDNSSAIAPPPSAVNAIHRKHLQQILGLHTLKKNDSSLSLDSSSKLNKQQQFVASSSSLKSRSLLLHRSLSEDHLLLAMQNNCENDKAHDHHHHTLTDDDLMAMFDVAAMTTTTAGAAATVPNKTIGSETPASSASTVVAIAATTTTGSSATTALRIPPGHRLVSEREYTRLHFELEDLRKRISSSLSHTSDTSIGLTDSGSFISTNQTGSGNSQSSSSGAGGALTTASVTGGQVNKKEKIRCAMCCNYEDQLQSMQENYIELEKIKTTLQHNLSDERILVSNLREIQGDLENRLKTRCSAHAEKIIYLETRVATIEDNFKVNQSRWIDYCKKAKEEFDRLHQERKQTHEKFVDLKKKYDSFIGSRNAVKARQLRNDDIQLPNTIEELQLYALQLREQYIDTLAGKEHLEETFHSENMLLRDQLARINEQWKTVNTQYERSRVELQELEALRDSATIELEKHRQLCHDKHERADELTSEIWELKRKCASLQIELENSESVQRDFVQLSQRLQMQLEQLRQQESNDVRWQHEEDVLACNECNAAFPLPSAATSMATAFLVKKKLHCRHCGKIFCADCLNKTVYSGPSKRPARVCSVCHTMLVKDAVPYFSIQSHTNYTVSNTAAPASAASSAASSTANANASMFNNNRGTPSHQNYHQQQQQQYPPTDYAGMPGCNQSNNNVIGSGSGASTGGGGGGSGASGGVGGGGGSHVST